MVAMIAAGLLALAGYSPAAAQTIVPHLTFPDLIPAPATSLRLDENVDGGIRALRLGFDGYVRNAGPGALEVRGRIPQPGAPTNEMLDTFQRVYRGTGAPDELGFRDLRRDPRPRLVFETTDGHDHFHLKDAVTYELRGEGIRLAGAKQTVGFCLQDTVPFMSGGSSQPFYTDPETNRCGFNQPTAPEVKMGVQAKWQDMYQVFVPFQWIDVSEVPPGTYQLLEVVDPTDVVAENVETNNVGGSVEVQIAGFRGLPRTIRTRGAGRLEIDLPTERIENDLEGRPVVGSPEFRISEPPKHGYLVGSTSEWSADGTATYVATDRSGRTDTFHFQVRDANFRAFPREAYEATITIVPHPT